ncbi:MAG: hypothetical protein WCI66_04695 [Gammaproteobacteria bacterium]|jgi:hypothetical protein
MRTTTLGLIVSGLLLAASATAQINAPSELPAVRYAANTVTTASFAVGLTLDSGLTYTGTAQVSDKISIIGKVRPEAAHVGQLGDLYVVDFVNGTWTMRNRDGIYVPWSFQIPDLVPYKEQVRLTTDNQVDVYTGSLGISGSHRIYIGYKPQGGLLYYSPAPKLLTFTQVSATDQAYSAFVSSISPNIVQSRCVLCHVKGGAAEAAGAYHIFQIPLATSLETNFKIFQNLVSLRGVNYILTKVSGGNSHGGGVQLTANSVDYKEFQNFLTLVAQDQPAMANTSSTGMSDPYESNPYGYAY